MAGMTACKTCGTEVVIGVLVCPDCGANPAVEPREVAPAAPAIGARAGAERASRLFRCTSLGCSGEVSREGEECPFCGEPVFGDSPRLNVLGSLLPLLCGEALVLGRAHGDAADLLAKHANVSQRHAEVDVRDGEVWVTDLHSTNGTYIDGRRLEPFEPTHLQPGVELRLAADVSLHLERPR
jgi:FHA domain